MHDRYHIGGLKVRPGRSNLRSLTTGQTWAFDHQITVGLGGRSLITSPAWAVDHSITGPAWTVDHLIKVQPRPNSLARCAAHNVPRFRSIRSPRSMYRRCPIDALVACSAAACQFHSDRSNDPITALTCDWVRLSHSRQI